MCTVCNTLSQPRLGRLLAARRRRKAPTSTNRPQATYPDQLIFPVFSGRVACQEIG